MSTETRANIERLVNVIENTAKTHDLSPKCVAAIREAVSAVKSDLTRARKEAGQ